MNAKRFLVVALSVFFANVSQAQGEPWLYVKSNHANTGFEVRHQGTHIIRDPRKEPEHTFEVVAWDLEAADKVTLTIDDNSSLILNRKKPTGTFKLNKFGTHTVDVKRNDQDLYTFTIELTSLELKLHSPTTAISGNHEKYTFQLGTLKQQDKASIALVDETQRYESSMAEVPDDGGKVDLTIEITNPILQSTKTFELATDLELKHEGTPTIVYTYTDVRRLGRITIIPTAIERPEIESITENVTNTTEFTVKHPIRSGIRPQLLTPQPTVTVKKRHEAKLGYRVNESTDFSTNETVDAEISAPLELRAGNNDVQLRFQKGWTYGPSLNLSMDVPRSDYPIAIEQHSPTPWGPFANMPPIDNGSSKTITVYDGYVRLRGTGYRSGAKLSIVALEKSGNNLTFHPRGPIDLRITDLGYNQWDAEAELPKPTNGAEGVFFVRSEMADGYRVSSLFEYAFRTSERLSSPDLSSKIKVKGPTEKELSGSDKIYRTNKSSVILGITTESSAAGVAVFLDDEQVPVTVTQQSNEYLAELRNLANKDYKVQVAYVQGNKIGELSEPFTLSVRTTGPRVRFVRPQNFGTAPGVNSLTITFDPANPLDWGTAKKVDNYLLSGRNADGQFPDGSLSRTPQYVSDTNSVILTVTGLTPNVYRLTIKGTGTEPIKDLWGNPLENNNGVAGQDHVEILGSGPDGDLEVLSFGVSPLAAHGLSGQPAPYVEFPEFTEPRDVPLGFNPADKVITAVSRLYYFRDAHRVAQIVNRKAKSYRRLEVDTAQRLADKVRSELDATVIQRKKQEQVALEAARKTREAEARLNEVQQQYQQLSTEQQREALGIQNARALRNRLQAAGTSPPQDLRQEALAAFGTDDLAAIDRILANQESEITKTSNDLESLQMTISRLRNNVETLRSTEAAANQSMIEYQLKEDRLAKETFRREVAATLEDPDTFAPGDPDSDDPVEQVSVTVLGSAEIQLRGPAKGVNIIRRIIHQIDKPVGKVQISVHTVQINGERAPRMEKVATQIQDYVDHSRFLTVLSGQMLRRAVAVVASQHAEAACAQLTVDGDTQEARNRKYLDAFFGRDFINELAAMNSEFLNTGNKLLSLHSMDTTSLASTLFLLSLAKNNVREAILAEFERMIMEEFPMREHMYFDEGGLRDKHQKFIFMAENARFAWLRSYFDETIVGPDTLTPLQREFLKLAQVLKARLVVEKELQLRIDERAMIEDRFRDINKELRELREREQRASTQLDDLRKQQARDQEKIVNIIGIMQQRAKAVSDREALVNARIAESEMSSEQVTQEYLEKIKSHLNNPDSSKLEPKLREATETAICEFNNRFQGENAKGLRAITTYLKFRDDIENYVDDLDLKDDADVRRFKELSSDAANKLMANLRSTLNNLKDAWELGADLNYPLQSGQLYDEIGRTLNELLEKDPETFTSEDINRINVVRKSIRLLTDEAVLFIRDMSNRLERLSADLSTNSNRETTKAAFPKMLEIQSIVLERTKGNLHSDLKQLFETAIEAFNKTFSRQLDVMLALEEIERSRNTIDHKKLLDMRIDRLEAQFIDLLEGTRAHTAVIDNYIARLATALEADFNTQFYYPAFRMIRNVGTSYDVSLGQIETTSILTNNRTFAKVEPQATFEFDLPKRDILITEAMQGASAMMDEYGALLNDPTFLALTKLKSGQPTSSMAQGTGAGVSPVRSVLPTLASSPEERVLVQDGPGSREFGSALEALIPEPAIYKFETGTGYEIRPVIQPDGQAVVFDFDYMYTTNVREPVRADEKHLGRVRRHFVHTAVQLGNYELREVSRYIVALKAARTGKGVPLLEDIPGLGVLFRPLPSDESALQQNIILAQTVIFPTLFDLMGLRIAPTVAELDPLSLANRQFIAEGRDRYLNNRVVDISASSVDDFLQVPYAQRRGDLYRSQETIPNVHPNGYRGPGMGIRDGHLQEGYSPTQAYPETPFVPRRSIEGSDYLPRYRPAPTMIPGDYFPEDYEEELSHGLPDESANAPVLPKDESTTMAPGKVEIPQPLKRSRNPDGLLNGMPVGTQVEPAAPPSVRQAGSRERTDRQLEPSSYTPDASDLERKAETKPTTLRGRLQRLLPFQRQ